MNERGDVWVVSRIVQRKETAAICDTEELADDYIQELNELGFKSILYVKECWNKWSRKEANDE